jgi:hypothetical protein
MSHQFTGLSEQSDCLSKIVTNHCVSGYTNNYPEDQDLTGRVKCSKSINNPGVLDNPGPYRMELWQK